MAGVLQRFEQRLEGAVTSAFARAFRSAVQPVEIAAALQRVFASERIGGDIIEPATTGYLYKSLIESTIRSTHAQAFRVALTSPATDTALENNEVAVLGAITATINFIDD